jgi:mono/diheme cytochrome c family protein
VTRHAIKTWLPVLAVAALFTGCNQQMAPPNEPLHLQHILSFHQLMAKQPKLKPQDPGHFFADGRSTRPFVEGTVARGSLGADPVFLTGKVSQLPPAVPATPVDPKLVLAQYAEEFPVEVNEALLKRGRERYNIYCNVCHGQTGSGDGTIVMRGFLKPPAFWEQSAGDKSHFSRGLRYQGAGQIELEKAPAGYLYHVITNGYGAMASYSAQIPPQDRWAIVAYIRALQKARATTITASAPAAGKDAHPKGAH